jgi:CheY-like chemotaxis protein
MIPVWLKNNAEQEIMKNMYRFIPDWKGKTFLIVDDEFVNIILLEAILEPSKATIKYAVNGAEAVDICNNDLAIDMVLMDVQMPVLDGYGARDLIKSIRPDLPIVAQTAYFDEEILAGKSLSGFDGCVQKPIEQEALFNTIYYQFNKLENKNIVINDSPL